jgi:hypothetical protein
MRSRHVTAYDFRFSKHRSPPIIELRDVSRHFAGVKILSGVSQGGHAIDGGLWRSIVGERKTGTALTGRKVEVLFAVVRKTLDMS